jgi:hypothetical protein
MAEKASRNCGCCARRRGARGARGCGGSDGLGSVFSRTVIAEMRTTAALGEDRRGTVAVAGRLVMGVELCAGVRRRRGRSVVPRNRSAYG